MRASLGSSPSTQNRVKVAEASVSSRTECSTLWMITGLQTFSSRLPRAPAMATAASLPYTWMQTMIMASLWVGLTLPGMIDEPGSFSGRSSSPSPLRGPEPSHRMSSAILIREAARVRSAPLVVTRASWAARAANLLGAVTNGQPGQLGDGRRHPGAELGMGVEPGPDGRPAGGQLVEVVEGGLDAAEVGVELGDVAGELLAQGERARRPSGGCGRSW